jgi:hypothetical protein
MYKPGNLLLFVLCAFFLLQTAFIFNTHRINEDLIVGKWYLEEQELLINGQAIDQHFEQMARELQSSNGNEIDPSMLARKFRRGYRGIPSGTVFSFSDDYSYRIDIPGKPSQSGMWKLRNHQQLELLAGGQVMIMEIKGLERQSAVFAIRDERPESSLAPGEYTIMELVLRLSR